MAGRFVGPLPKFSNSGLPLECGRNLDEIFQRLLDSTSGLNRVPGDPSEIQAGVAADPGTTSKAPALEDHVHPVDVSGTPGDVGATNAQGTGPGLARTDHTHRYGLFQYKGDLIGFDGTNPVVLNGADEGKVLTRDNGSPTGWAWSPPAGGSDILSWIGL
jgi:hypothetical protein